MSDNELLIAISDMMDTKLKPVNERLDRLEQSYDRLEQSYNRLEQSQKKMELTLENNMLPRLQAIEECYLSTFERYQSNIGQIETMQKDIDVIKTTIAKHSEIPQKLA